MHFLFAALASFLPRLVANLAIFFLNHCLHKHFAVAVQLLLLLRRLVRSINLHASMESWPALCTSLLTPGYSTWPALGLLCVPSLLPLPDVFVAVVEAQQMLKINIRKRAVHEENGKWKMQCNFSIQN